MSAMLSKSKIMAGLQCPKRLWLQVHHQDLAAPSSSPGIRQGNEVDAVARQLFPGGVLIDGYSLDESLVHTAQAIAQSQPHIYQATVSAERVLIKADILSRTPDGWVLTEVKAATGVKPEHIKDVAIQFWVLRQAGVSVTKAQLAHIDTDFVYLGSGRYDGLLKVTDVTVEAAALESQVADWIQRYRKVLSGREPICDIGPHCSTPVECEFIEYCDPYKGIQHRPDVLPRIGTEKLASWRQRGIFEMATVPDGEISEQQRVVKRAHLEQRPVVGENLAEVLAQLPYPRFYLDFETSNPAVPRFVGMHPYQHVTFQWSCHIERADGTVEHREFLVPDSDDPRERFITSMIAAVRTDGPICVWYASFEKTRLHELAADFPPYRAALSSIVDRIVDLHPLFVEHYYDPGMNGSWSIKNVAPTLDPAMSYGSLLEIRDGGAAMEAYLVLSDSRAEPMRRADLRAQLSAYCKHDTLAMLRLVVAATSSRLEGYPSGAS